MIKKLTLAAVAVAATATFASANTNSFFPIGDQRDGVSSIEVDVVRAESDGFLQIETFNGDILGTKAVNAGASIDVKVPLARTANTNLVAKLIVDGQVVDMESIRVK